MRFPDDQEAVVIVGSGAGGGTLATELCRLGIPVILLEAGPEIGPDEFVNDEVRSYLQMSWLEPRTTSGTWSIATSSPDSPCWMGKLVGGTTNLWAGVSLRFNDYEFRVLTEYGADPEASLLDWPLTLAELEPYYERAEARMGVTHTHGIPPLPANNNYKVLANGALRVGYRQIRTGPVAINSLARDGRPATLQDGFTVQGDKGRARWSTLVAELPRARATGNLDLRTRSHAVHILVGHDGLVDAVVYVDEDGVEHRQKARVLCLAANAIETPRLLLLSASTLFPDGLANSSGEVGRNYMRHVSGFVLATFEQPVRMYRGEPMAGVIADEARHDRQRGFNGGYYLELVSGGPCFVASALPQAWGPDFAEAMEQYAHMAALWICGEDMPRATNRVSLNPAVLDSHRLPAPHLHVDDHRNDVAMRADAYARGEQIYDAVGALKHYRVPPFPSGHNLGTCRMSRRASDGVVNSYGQAHDVKNLFVSDGSQFTSSAAANPTLTIVALALRQAEYLAGELRRRNL
jgi:choline dehydrogenase-like flavoprotein